jgi:hypothetical protein
MSRTLLRNPISGVSDNADVLDFETAESTHAATKFREHWLMERGKVRTDDGAARAHELQTDVAQLLLLTTPQMFFGEQWLTCGEDLPQRPQLLLIPNCTIFVLAHPDNPLCDANSPFSMNEAPQDAEPR